MAKCQAHVRCLWRGYVPIWLVAMGMLMLHSENQWEPGLILISVMYERTYEPPAQEANGKFVMKSKPLRNPGRIYILTPLNNNQRDQLECKYDLQDPSTIANRIIKVT
ncbi:hypothetical protein EDD85DRAFT_789321 [Armillaria nabsnona]|nr:hypothetical protein EDD85DRAFT_789321 [Armillaria nabsnona]